jgi:CheY-like chemotaxis protein
MTDPITPPLSVLIVDDCPDTTATLAMLTRYWGYRPLIANDGDLALRFAAEYHPLVVLLDIGMPRMSGWELARRLRQLPGLQDTLLVAVSGYGGAEDQRCSLQAGCDLHLTKPIELDRLQRLLASREEAIHGHIVHAAPAQNAHQGT